MATLHSTLHHKTKILCTMGPAIATQQKIEQLIRAGANAFRLNMSHGNYDAHAHYANIIRKGEERTGLHVPIIADLQGPKIRVANFADVEFMTLVTGQEVLMADVSTIRNKKLGTSATLIPVHYPTLGSDVKGGDVLLFDDGLMQVQVIATDGEVVRALVTNGGKLKPRKGINLPNINVSQPSITAKDRADIRFAIEQGVDYIAVSFVRRAADVENVKRYIAKHGGKQLVIAKIEKPEALACIEQIIEVSDAIMVARGDLGVEIPAQSVPIAQKRIIKLCNIAAKPVITATQMLESMIQNPRPTRAEASDVANAVLDGTDAVMLSAETSVGAYPVEAVHYMRTICTEAERELIDDGLLHESPVTHLADSTNTDSIAMAAARIAEEHRVAGIISLSYSGRTARLISNRRPRTPILAVTTDRHVARHTNLNWGVIGMVVEKTESTDETIERIKQQLVKTKVFAAGSIVIFTIGRPLVGRAKTNMLSIETL
jgi:pyruvate kinase